MKMPLSLNSLKKVIEALKKLLRAKFDDVETYLEAITKNLVLVIKSLKETKTQASENTTKTIRAIEDTSEKVRKAVEDTKIDEERLAKKIGQAVYIPQVDIEIPEKVEVKETSWISKLFSHIFKAEVTNQNPIKVEVTNISSIKGTGVQRIIGGGGGGAQLQDITGAIYKGATEENQNVLKAFPIADSDETNATTKYYGYLKPDGNWYIMRQVINGDISTFRYTSKASNTPSTNEVYSTAWTNKTTLTYDYASNINF